MKPKIVQITALDSTMKSLIGLLNFRLSESGYEVHCICSPGDDIQKLIDMGYIVHPIQIDRKISIKSNLNAIKKITKIIKEIKPEIVHVHTPVASVLGRISAKLAGVKNIVYTAHGFYFHEGMSGKVYNVFYNIEKWVGRLCTDYIFTQSKEDYELAKKNSFLSKKKSGNYLHISNGIDIRKRFNVNRFEESSKEGIRQELGINDDSVVISFIGRMVKEKGIMDLLKAIEIVCKEHKVDLIAMGDVGASERDKTLLKLISSNQKRNLHFIGRVNNVEDYLHTSEIFILPSYREGMPRSIIEAMALGNAIIATNIRGSREEVIQGYNGFLVDVASPEQIAENIIKLIKDRDLLKKFQQASISEVKSKYDEEEVVRKQLEVFHKMIEGA